MGQETPENHELITLQQQARALGDPTRHRIFRYVAEAGKPVTVAELTAHLGLNHNAIRQHLAKLVDAALVVEASVPVGGPGRPKLVYEPDPTAEGRWGPVSPYERLSLLLNEVIRTGDAPLDVGRRAALQYRPTALGDDPLATVSATMARLGFDPEVRRQGTRVELLLRTCPFAAAVVADGETVCAIHLGICQGLVDGTPLVFEQLVIRDPRRAKCRLRLREQAVPE